MCLRSGDSGKLLLIMSILFVLLLNSSYQATMFLSFLYMPVSVSFSNLFPVHWFGREK